MGEEVFPPPPHASWKTERQGLFAFLKQELSKEIEAMFRPLDGRESDDDESSSGDEERTEVSRALYGCFANYLGDTSKSSFDNLAEYSTIDKRSAPVNAKLATMIEEFIKGNLLKTKLEELGENYPRPENCDF